MNIHYHNTYTVSDSDDSVIIKNRQETTSHINERLSSPEEPDFFRQVMQSQKRKILSPEINVHPKKDTCFTQESVYNKKPNIKMCIENPELNICELIEPKRKKRLTKEEREEKKNQEKVQKDAKKKLTEKLKRLNPKECMKYMTVHTDINLQNRDYGKQILSEIQNTNAKYKIELNSSVSHSITWSRQISDIVSEDENFMLLIWDFDYATSLIISNQLLEKINQLKLYKAQLTLIIYTTSDQNKNKKFKKNGFSFSDILNSLNQMMLSCQVSFRFIDNTNEIGLAVLYFTKSIAQKPYKLNKYEEEQEGCDWYATGHTKNCVTVDKNGTGLTQLWRQMLLQFPLCALETSEAITSVYDSPIALLEAYDNCSTRLEGEILLQDIPVRRGYGPLASNRRIGPELSKKIYTFFTDNTGFATLSQE